MKKKKKNTCLCGNKGEHKMLRNGRIQTLCKHCYSFHKKIERSIEK